MATADRNSVDNNLINLSHSAEMLAIVEHNRCETTHVNAHDSDSACYCPSMQMMYSMPTGPACVSVSQKQNQKKRKPSEPEIYGNLREREKKKT